MSQIKKGDEVIFKQRTARHLAAQSDLPWEYQNGTVLFINEEGQMAAVNWLQSHHSRTDDVPLKDIVAVFDKKQPFVSIGPFTGPSRILQEIVKEGEE